MPKHTHYDDLQKLADEHLKMRGVIEALVLIDQTPPPDAQKWRCRIDTLHWVLENQIDDVDNALQAAMLSDPGRARRSRQG